MTMLNRIDLLLRRNSRLPKLPWLRNALRKPYHSIMAMRGSGFDLNLAGIAPITVPVEYCQTELEPHETETVGASRILASRGVTLLISVHPQFVARYGGSVERIRALIEEAGHAIEVVGIDHEEHWLCQRA